MEQDKKLANDEDKAIFEFIPRKTGIALLVILIALIAFSFFIESSKSKEKIIIENSSKPNISLNISPQQMELICNKLAEEGCPCNSSVEDCEFLKVKDENRA